MTTIRYTDDAPAATEDAKPQIAFHRFAFAVLAFLLIPPVAFAGFVLIVDPYFVFGSPSWPGVNTVRPYYELQVVMAKPYQVSRLRPAAVSLGSSRVEVGLDPRHPGWTKGPVFNFALPSSNSYAVMLAFLHAQKHGAPLQQAVAGLDFFAFNINFPQASTFWEQRFDEAASREFARYLDDELAGRIKRKPAPAATRDWDETLYLAVNQDVRAAVLRHDFKSGREHFELAGRAEHRRGATVPADWEEESYLELHPDVATAISAGQFISGYHHWLAAGRAEGRPDGTRPADWNEAQYLAANPFVRARVALGQHRNAYLYHAEVGRKRHAGGAPPVGTIERLLLPYPALRQALYRGEEILGLVFSVTTARDALSTLRRQGEPAVFDSQGMRIWRGQDVLLNSLGGTGKLMRTRLLNGPRNPTLVAPKLQYCFTNAETGMTTFDPFRFMIRRAYAEGTDLRMFITPLHAAVHLALNALGLEERYAFWLKELVRINEEEAAKAKRPPFPLWDFSTANSITTEPIPEADDRRPMHWYWEVSHYRRATGDLILDRVLGDGAAVPARTLPADFGVRLTAANIDARLAQAKAGLETWMMQSDLALQVAREAAKPSRYSRQAEATCW
jgi:hypothetical protein